MTACRKETESILSLGTVKDLDQGQKSEVASGHKSEGRNVLELSSLKNRGRARVVERGPGPFGLTWVRAPQAELGRAPSRHFEDDVSVNERNLIVMSKDILFAKYHWVPGTTPRFLSYTFGVGKEVPESPSPTPNTGLSVAPRAGGPTFSALRSIWRERGSLCSRGITLSPATR